MILDRLTSPFPAEDALETREFDEGASIAEIKLSTGSAKGLLDEAGAFALVEGFFWNGRGGIVAKGLRDETGETGEADVGVTGAFAKGSAKGSVVIGGMTLKSVLAVSKE
jgi:hypothetical protein